MRVSIETNRSKIVIEDAFVTANHEEHSKHNQELVKLAYEYIVKRELSLEYKDGRYNHIVINSEGEQIYKD